MGDSFETQEKILASALKLFAEKGYHGTATSEIAKDCKIAEGTIFKYFKTKKILLDSVLNKIINEILPNIAFSTKIDFSQLDDKEAAKQYIKEILLDKILMIRSNFNAFRVVVTELQYHDDLKKTYTDRLIPSVIGMLEGFYEAGVCQGFFRKMESHIVARSFMGVMAVMLLESVVLSRNTDFAKELDVIFDIFLNGIVLCNT